MEMIEKAIEKGRPSLSGYSSKQVLADYGIPVTRDIPVNEIDV